jgi:hypothetical protein
MSKHGDQLEDERLEMSPNLLRLTDAQILRTL